jgi:hypothetical protein
MKCRFSRLLSLLPVLAMVGGCAVSLQSSQYSFVKGLFERKQEPPPPNWQIDWRGGVYPVYAINAGSDTYFANEDGLAVKFDGWQVVQVAEPGIGFRQVAVITHKPAAQSGEVALFYADGKGRPLLEHYCDSWKEVDLEGVGNTQLAKRFVQNCDQSRGNYRNVIDLNSESQLIKLIFTVVPDEDPITIRFLGD